MHCVVLCCVYACIMLCVYACIVCLCVCVFRNTLCSMFVYVCVLCVSVCMCALGCVYVHIVRTGACGKSEEIEDIPRIEREREVEMLEDKGNGDLLQGGGVCLLAFLF